MISRKCDQPNCLDSVETISSSGKASTKRSMWKRLCLEKPLPYSAVSRPARLSITLLPYSARSSPSTSRRMRRPIRQWSRASSVLAWTATRPRACSTRALTSPNSASLLLTGTRGAGSRASMLEASSICFTGAGASFAAGFLLRGAVGSLFTTAPPRASAGSPTRTSSWSGRSRAGPSRSPGRRRATGLGRPRPGRWPGGTSPAR